MNKEQVIEQVKIDLAERIGKHSHAQVSVKNDDTSEAYISNAVEISVSADDDDAQVWVNIRQNTYASVGGFSGQTFTTHHDLISHHFTKAEAQALLACLVRELSFLD